VGASPSRVGRSFETRTGERSRIEEHNPVRKKTGTEVRKNKRKQTDDRRGSKRRKCVINATAEGRAKTARNGGRKNRKEERVGK